MISPRTRLGPGALADRVESARQATEARALDRLVVDICAPPPDRPLPLLEMLDAPVERSHEVTESPGPASEG